MLISALKWSAIALVVALVGLQFLRPARTNPAVDAAMTIEATGAVPADVAAILDRACADCHSHETDWPWYSEVAPVSWFVADHVNHGRKHLNFSEWGGYDEAEAMGKLAMIAVTVRERSMPLPSYLRAHPEAHLSDADVERLSNWANAQLSKR